MATILITGATGAVGRCLVPHLERAGHRLIYLVRPAASRAPRERLGDALGRSPDAGDRCWSGDITRPRAGVAAATVRAARGEIDHVLHCAGSIRFDDPGDGRTWRTNVEGTRNVLALADELGAPAFHHLSTVYVAGDAARLGEDELGVGQSHRNAYEASKYAAEQAVVEWRGGPRSVYRPSILIGDSRSGVTPAFTGYYAYFRALWRLRARLLRQWRRDPRPCRREGIELGRDGVLRLPLGLDCSPTSTLNLIPADWFGSTLTRLLEVPGAGRTYNLVHPSPPRTEWILDLTARLLGIAGLRYGRKRPDLADRRYLQRLQRALDRGVQRFRPYVTHEPALPCDRVAGVLDGSYAPPPAIDEPLMRRMMDYAMRADFGTARRPVESALP